MAGAEPQPERATATPAVGSARKSADHSIGALAMTTIVVPFAGSTGKTRLQVPAGLRQTLSLAMFADVLSACVAIGQTRIATSDAEGAQIARKAGAEVVNDPGGGQSRAVAAALADVEGAVLVVNADLPCVAPHDLRALLDASPPSGFALVEAPDGTTNALSLSHASAFAGLYGRDSAARFREHAAALGVDAVTLAVPNLADDVDTLDDLYRLQLRCGPRTRTCFSELQGSSR